MGRCSKVVDWGRPCRHNEFAAAEGATFFSAGEREARGSRWFRKRKYSKKTTLTTSSYHFSLRPPSPYFAENYDTVAEARSSLVGSKIPPSG